MSRERCSITGGCSLTRNIHICLSGAKSLPETSHKITQGPLSLERERERESSSSHSIGGVVPAVRFLILSSSCRDTPLFSFLSFSVVSNERAALCGTMGGHFIG